MGPNGEDSNSGRTRSTVDETGELFECSAKFCRSCSAGVLADCIAICCCPCAVVNLLALAFVKVPWMVGRRCLRLLKKKGKSLRRRKKIENVGISESVTKEEGEGENMEFSLEAIEGERQNFSAGFEAERVWMELYQLGNLGFGRVSFTGIPGKII